MKKENIREAQLAQLKDLARILLQPMGRLPFAVVVEAMTGHEVLPVMDTAKDNKLLNALAKACSQTVAESERSPIKANRPNDVSVKVEERLQVFLEGESVCVEKPRPKEGRGGGGGYPDRLLWLEETPSYLEVKVSREENMTQGSARNFFYQPTVNSKIQHSARHLLAGFSLREQEEKVWVLTGWKIADLFDLRVKLKPEYNADNLEIYRDGLVLMEGDANGIKTRR